MFSLNYALIRNELVKYKSGLDSLPNGDVDHIPDLQKEGSIPDLGEAGSNPDPGEGGSIPDPGEVSSIPDSGNCDWESEQGGLVNNVFEFGRTRCIQNQTVKLLQFCAFVFERVLK